MSFISLVKLNSYSNSTGILFTIGKYYNILISYKCFFLIYIYCPKVNQPRKQFPQIGNYRISVHWNYQVIIFCMDFNCVVIILVLLRVENNLYFLIHSRSHCPFLFLLLITLSNFIENIQVEGGNMFIRYAILEQFLILNFIIFSFFISYP